MKLSMTLQAVVAATILLVQTFIAHCTPVGRHKRSAPVAEFLMPQQAYDSYPWSVENPHVSHQKQSSQEEFLNSYGSCPTKILEGPNVPTYMRSNCPWWYEADHNAARFPTTILTAKSPCQFCIGSNNTLQCAAVFKEVNLLLQTGTDSNGNFLFTESSKNFTIGFTCTEPKTAPNNVQTTIPPIDRK